MLLTVYNASQAPKWNAIVKSFSNWDIYYLYEYAHSLMVHGDGEPLLIYFEDGKTKLCYVVMKRDIADDDKFSGRIEKNKYFDLETPYGYGGPLTETELPEAAQMQFAREMRNWCTKNGIVTQFIRFHPLLMNHEAMRSVIQTKYLRDTVYIDTLSPEEIMQNMDSKNRNMVRKAKKSGVNIIMKSIDDYAEFIPIYEETMDRNQADDYYIFKDDYFASLTQMKENANIFYAELDGKIVSGAIMLFNDKYMHYHLSGTYNEYRPYAISNLLLYEAACWAGEHYIFKFHLGGGVEAEDSLFHFKKQFNKNGRRPFVVGRTIFDQQRYDYLLEVRQAAQPDFDKNNMFMIQYRK